MNGNDYHLDRLLELREAYRHLSADDLADIDESQPITTMRPVIVATSSPVCALCGDPLVIVDWGRVCRQCRLEGKVA